MNIGENIKKVRELKNISQEKLSKLSSMPRTSLGRYERGERTPNIDTLNKIARALKVNIDILLYFTGDIAIYEDALKFISNLYPDEYYDFEETLEPIANILDIKKDDPELMIFLLGQSDNKKLYESMANAFGLTSEQIRNCVLSNKLFSFLEDIGLNPGEYIALFRKVIKEDILIYQSIDDLLNHGFSADNEKIIEEYFMKRGYLDSQCDFLGKYNYTNTPKAKTSNESLYKDSEIIEINISQDILKSKIDNIKNLNSIFELYGLDITIFEDNNNIIVNVRIDKDDFCKDFYLDDFLEFTDKIYWGIEREIDYLKHLCD